jgi:hypothetical protein
LDTTLRVTGTGFTKASTVSFNGSSRIPTFVSSTQLTLALASFGCGRFRGTNPDDHRHGLREYFNGELQRVKPHTYLWQQHPTDARSRQH